MRPWNDLVHVIYWAASSFRACTLRLPSVAFSSPLSSLKLSAAFTASALTMPRRARSWIRRSSSAARSPAGSALRLCSGVSALRATPDLATIPPRDDPAEHDVQPAEPGRHQPVAPRRGAEQRGRAGHHEAQPHHRHDPHRERPSRHESGAVQQQPGAGRSEEHTSELQSHSDLVCRLLLEKKNKTYNQDIA